MVTALCLYNGQDYADAISYIKEYEKSHGDMVLIKTENEKHQIRNTGQSTMLVNWDNVNL